MSLFCTFEKAKNTTNFLTFQVLNCLVGVRANKAPHRIPLRLLRVNPQEDSRVDDWAIQTHPPLSSEDINPKLGVQRVCSISRPKESEINTPFGPGTIEWGLIIDVPPHSSPINIDGSIFVVDNGSVVVVVVVGAIHFSLFFFGYLLIAFSFLPSVLNIWKFSIRKVYISSDALKSCEFFGTDIFKPFCSWKGLTKVKNILLSSHFWVRNWQR